MMRQRIITAALALLIFIPAVLYGDWPFVLLIYLMATVGFSELFRMRKTMKKSLIPFVFTVASLWILLLPHFATPSWMNKIHIFLILVVLLLIMTVMTKNKFTFDDVSFTVMALIYITI